MAMAAKPLPSPPDQIHIRRSLVSVSDKTGLLEFAERLARLGIELISTGGTARALSDAGLLVREVGQITGFPEILDGRVKSLHPLIHGGILARRTDPEDRRALLEHGIAPIDLVVVNLYPFAEAVRDLDVTDAVAAENIDIGGPAMLRAAAKNWFFVAAVSDPAQYGPIVDELEARAGQLSLATRRALARAAFARTTAYDAAILAYLDRAGAGPAMLPERFAIELPRAQALRYGENPHQRGALYGQPSRLFEQLHGKELSFNNILDLSAALHLIAEFQSAPPTVAILKHTNPCGVGTAETLRGAYERALATDRQSPFGGIVVCNRRLDLAAAEAIDAVFTEIVIAPEFDEDALEFLRVKQNRRLIRALGGGEDAGLDIRSAVGGLLAQEQDPVLPPADRLRAEFAVVTHRSPTDSEWADLDFAWRVCKHVKSNAIVYARGGATLGIGAGQMSRIDASELAVAKAAKSGLSLEGASLASDAFFPFADGLLAAARAGASAVIQPGGSVRDEEVIAAANQHDLAMVFTGKRHFRH